MDPEIEWQKCCNPRNLVVSSWNDVFPLLILCFSLLLYYYLHYPYRCNFCVHENIGLPIFLLLNCGYMHTHDSYFENNYIFKWSNYLKWTKFRSELVCSTLVRFLLGLSSYNKLPVVFFLINSIRNFLDARDVGHVTTGTHMHYLSM